MTTETKASVIEQDHGSGVKTVSRGGRRWAFFPPPVQVWCLLHPQATAEHLGLVPSFLWNGMFDQRHPIEQINERYVAGGGWHDSKGATVDYTTGRRQYPGDPAQMPIAVTAVNDHKVFMYADAFVAVFEHDRVTHRSARLD